MNAASGHPHLFNRTLGGALTVLALVSGLAACASNDPPTTTADAPKVNCEREYRVGSNIPVRDCRAAMTEEERQRMIQQSRDNSRSAPNQPK